MRTHTRVTEGVRAGPLVSACLGLAAMFAGCGAAGSASSPSESPNPTVGETDPADPARGVGAATTLGTEIVDPDHRIRGVSFSAPRAEMAPDALEPAAMAGANWVSVIPYAFIDPAEPVVTFDRQRQFWGETTVGIATTIAYARASGLSTLLKPHLWVRGQGWPGEFEPEGAEDWDTFLAGYRDYILRFAHVADSMDVEMFSVGTEVDVVALARPEYWRGLIAEVRDIYAGPLTYAANWDKYAEIEFWDALDFVGVDAYFPLVGSDTPSVDQLVAGWRPWRDELHEVATRTGRPILFTEFGYRSVDGAAGNQWELPAGRRGRGIEPNHTVQASAYEALFRVWWDCPWFAGGFAWKWYAGSPAEEWIATGFSPQGKPAETVMASWYGGDATAGAPPPLLSGPGTEKG